MMRRLLQRAAFGTFAAVLLSAPTARGQGAPSPPLGAGEVWHVPSTGQTGYRPARARSGGWDRPGSFLVPGSAGPPPARTEQVFWPDERVRVRDTTVFPYSAQCRLYITFPDQTSWVGSGTLIGSGSVITAGHCVYLKERGGWATRVEVVPGQNGHREPFGRALVRQFHTFVGWTHSQDYAWDLAVVHLDRQVGDDTGWLGYGYLPSVSGWIGHLSAYSADLLSGAQFHSSGHLLDRGREVLYRLDSSGGASGGGIYVFHPDSLLVVAVNSWEGDRNGQQYNGGPKIDADRVTAIHGWLHPGD